jgi:hypothetical protein
MKDLIWKVLLRCRDINWKCDAVEKYIPEINRLSHNLAVENSETEKTNISSTMNLKKQKLRAIEKELVRWNKKHPNNDSTIMQPVEVAIGLIDDLRKNGILE